MAKKSSQKFIGRNRAPRVQVEYDLELYGAEKKINLPFVMGVMADLSGKPTEASSATSPHVCYATPAAVHVRSVPASGT